MSDEKKGDTVAEATSPTTRLIDKFEKFSIKAAGQSGSASTATSPTKSEGLKSVEILEVLEGTEGATKESIDTDVDADEESFGDTDVKGKKEIAGGTTEKTGSKGSTLPVKQSVPVLKRVEAEKVGEPGPSGKEGGGGGASGGPPDQPSTLGGGGGSGGPPDKPNPKVDDETDIAWRYMFARNLNIMELQQIFTVMNEKISNTDFGELEYSGGSPHNTMLGIKACDWKVEDMPLLMWFFINRGNNPDRIYERSTDKGKAVFDSLRTRYRLTTNTQHPTNITLARVAAAQLMTLIPLNDLPKPMTLSVLKLRINRPYRYLAIPGIAGAIPKSKDFDDLFKVCVSYQKQIFAVLNQPQQVVQGMRNRMMVVRQPIDNSEYICGLMRDGDFYNDEWRMTLMNALGLVNDDGRPITVDLSPDDTKDLEDEKIDLRKKRIRPGV